MTEQTIFDPPSKRGTKYKSEETITMAGYNKYGQKPKSRKSITDDRKRTAKAPGKRTSKKLRSGIPVKSHVRRVNGKRIRVKSHTRVGGKKYTERRQNRSDIPGSRL